MGTCCVKSKNSHGSKSNFVKMADNNETDNKRQKMLEAAERRTENEQRRGLSKESFNKMQEKNQKKV